MKKSIPTAGRLLLSGRLTRVLSSPQYTGRTAVINTDAFNNLQTVPNMDLTGRTSVEFSVKALQGDRLGNAGAYVMLYLASGGIFEIVIGVNLRNTRCFIRRQRGTGPLEADYDGSVPLLTADGFSTYVLDWSTPRVLKLFSKSGSGVLTELLKTPEQTETKLDVTRMAVSTYTTTGVFQVQVSPPRPERGWETAESDAIP